MPELPEVETLCRQLNTILPGEEIRAVAVLDSRLGELPPLAGKRIMSVNRQGKWLQFGMNDGLTVDLHLRMTGRLLWQRGDLPIPRYARLVVTVGGGRLILIDPRRFALFTVLPDERRQALLPDPLEGLSTRRLRKIAEKRRMPVKSFLMDQRFIAGIGNIYACEILARAAVDPRRPAESLTGAEWRKIAEAARVVLQRAVACRGTTVSDWRDLFGVSGSNQEHLEVYSRTGQLCNRCGGRIERLTMAGRGTWLCSSCQK